MTSVLASLAERARSLVATDRRVLVGITGPPGTGKSTLVDLLVDELAEGPVPDGCEPGAGACDWVAHVPMDGFHLADVQLLRLGLIDRKGAPDTFDVAGYTAALERLRRDTDDVVYMPGFERRTEQPIAASIAVPPSARLVLTEGNYLLLDDGGWPRARSHLAEVWYCDLDAELRRARLVDRHVRFGKSRPEALAWVARSDEANAERVVAGRDKADLVIAMASLRAVANPG
jgi:pantothenate kinase